MWFFRESTLDSEFHVGRAEQVVDDVLGDGGSGPLHILQVVGYVVVEQCNLLIQLLLLW